ncbi:hypothetical protein HHK36_003837 [Tetracentron sinense]|uniref:Uncharacterized protein n=1 Tax=Tetracentron sinense TaxID=13715 RepID=A0A834ZPS6_TETSI|nr:hypothetical protein HHK36_003837 [Tetracentron sinense]
MNKLLTVSYLLLLLLLPILVSAECTCNAEDQGGNRSKALKYKLIAFALILVAGAIGVCLPIVGKSIIPALRPGNDIFFMIKALAAGVILATGFMHILPHAFENLTSPCLKVDPWGGFPFTGFIAMMSAIVTLMVDTFATSYYKSSHFNKAQSILNEDEEHAGHVHVHGSAASGSPDLVRHRVLELGIVVHSVIIGISLGSSQSAKTIKPLVAALSFHQFFEGMGLGGCISQAKFKSRAVTIMAIFFSLTTPVGIAIGIGISKIYNENSPTALIVEGVFDSASAGILIYMALVDLLAADFMNPRMQSNKKIQLGANLSLLFGAGCMSLLAMWA